MEWAGSGRPLCHAEIGHELDGGDRLPGDVHRGPLTHETGAAYPSPASSTHAAASRGSSRGRRDVPPSGHDAPSTRDAPRISPYYDEPPLHAPWGEQADEDALTTACIHVATDEDTFMHCDVGYHFCTPCSITWHLLEIPNDIITDLEYQMGWSEKV